MGIIFQARQLLRELIVPTEKLPQRLMRERVLPIIQDSETVAIDVNLSAVFQILFGEGIPE